MADDPTFEKVGVHRGDDRIPRDLYQRYLLPEPGGSDTKARAWTRVTTIAGELKDRYGLEKWDDRNIVWGIGQRPALYAQAAAAKLTDVQTLDGIAKRAKEAADASAGADLGSALHTMAERRDRGEDFQPAEPFARDLRAYDKAMDIAGIATCVGWIERVVVIPEIGACGTLDRLSNGMEWVLPRIGDLKTAGLKEDRQTKKERDPIASYGMQDIPLQLAMYAHATHWYDLDAEVWVEMPQVDQERAMVYHVPAGSGECRVWEIDIVAGWEAVRYALWERDWRKRKDLGQVVLAINVDGEIKRGQPEGQGGGSVSSGADVSHQGNGADDGSREPSAGVRDPSDGSGEGVSPSPGDPPAHPSPPPASGPIAQMPARAGERMHQMGEAVHQIRALYGEDDMVRAWENLSELPNVDDPLAPAHQERWEWCRTRVNTIKDHPEARARLASLWSLVDYIPLFPNDKNPDRTGPRTWAELSKVLGICDLVEMEFQFQFPEGSDPSPDVVLPSPSERRKQAEAKYQEEQTAKRKTAAAKARATRARNKAAKGET
jgi:hypothetical protein